MKRALHTTAAMLAACLLAACQTAGNGRAFNTDATTLRQQLQPGRTTKPEVLREFGEPSVYRFANGFEAWTYQRTLGIPKFVNYLPVVGWMTPALADRTVELALLFDAEGALCKMDVRTALAAH